jgi:hypothetical protein
MADGEGGKISVRLACPRCGAVDKRLSGPPAILSLVILAVVCRLGEHPVGRVLM